jgi:hypothetical protein
VVDVPNPIRSFGDGSHTRPLAEHHVVSDLTVKGKRRRVSSSPTVGTFVEKFDGVIEGEVGWNRVAVVGKPLAVDLFKLIVDFVWEIHSWHGCDI